MFIKNPLVGSKEIDSEILPLVEELNKMGLITVSSCAGHKKGNLIRQAQIVFKANNVDVILSQGIVSINWKREIKEDAVKK